MPDDPDSVIERYRLAPHPEGGYYRELHRSSLSLGVPPGYSGERVALTAIYFLLARGDFSAFHRVKGDEVWVHLAGGALELIVLDREPRRRRIAGVADGGPPVAVVPAGAYQAARPLGDWTLAACLVAPGFEFADFDLPNRKDLLRRFPAHIDLIRRFTR